MKCPFCGYEDSKVIDTRPADENASIRRRRECIQCKHRFTTYEQVEHLPLIVIKKDGSRQTFDRGKLLSGMLKACEKRPVPFGVLENAVDAIEQQLQGGLERELPSVRIGELAMEKLKDIDGVAYVRFASVYRQFKDLDRFMEELRLLMDHKSSQAGGEGTHAATDAPPEA